MIAPTAGLPAELVDRLAKVAGMLGSDHAGERSAAAWQATRILLEHKLTWRQLVEAAGPREPEPVAMPSYDLSWRDKLDDCVAARWRLTEWEARFVATLAGYRHRPSEKQLRTLDQLHRKVIAA